MAVHDWSSVGAGIFHDFHQTWISTIKNRLNGGLLPDGFYALAEQVAEGPRPDVIALEETDTGRPPGGDPGGAAVAIEQQLPRVQYTEEYEADIYANAADHVVIRHASGDRVVAFVEIVSVGNKQSQHELEQLFSKLDQALSRGCHLLVIDLHPPNRLTPNGLHAAFWEHRAGTGHRVTTEKPLGLSAYRAHRPGENVVHPRAWFQPVAVGEELPDMPLFLTASHYINVPLESTYLEAWQGVPGRWKRVIESASE